MAGCLPHRGGYLQRDVVLGLTLFVGLSAGTLGCSDDASSITPPVAAPFPIGGLAAPDFSAIEPQPLPSETEAFEGCDRGPVPVFDRDAVSTAHIASVGQEIYAWIAGDEARAATADTFPLGASTQWRDLLDEAAPKATEQARSQFAATFAGAGRVAWANPWATRLLTDQAAPRLLRLKLNLDARWLVLEGESAVVVDLFGNRLADDVAAEFPEAIAGVFLGVPQVNEGKCEPSYARSMVITNPAVIEEWSIGGASEVERMTGDVYKVEQLMLLLRPCGFEVDFETWAHATACSNYAGDDSEVGSYERGLAFATAAYSPGVRQLARLADTLKEDIRAWAVDPLFVESERPPNVAPPTSADGGAFDGGYTPGDAAIGDAATGETGDVNGSGDAATARDADADRWRDAGPTESADGAAP